MSGVRSFNHARTMSPYAYLRVYVLNVPQRDLHATQGTYVTRQPQTVVCVSAAAVDHKSMNRPD